MSDVEAFEKAKLDAEFYEAFGLAFAEWAAIERWMFDWFWHLSGMQHAMSKAVFYSANSFGGRAALLQAVLPFADNATSEFLKAAITKSQQFCTFRNALAHGQTMIYVPENSTLLKKALIPGRNRLGDVSGAVSPDDLKAAAANFSLLSDALACALMAAQGHSDEALPSLDKCLEQVRALPNQANSR